MTRCRPGRRFPVGPSVALPLVAAAPSVPAPPAPPRPAGVHPIRLGALAAEIPLEARGVAPLAVVTGVTLHANLVRPGDLFAALPGSRAHGAEFAAAAVRAGA